MRLRWGALVVLAFAGPLAGIAVAGGTEVTGLGFRSRTPAEFREGEREDRSEDSKRSFHLAVPGTGTVLLTFSSHMQDDAALAQTEMALARGLDAVTAKAEAPDAQPRVTDARVPGAEEAYEVVADGEAVTWRTLSARSGGLRVSVTLVAPAGAEEQAEEAWRLATASLRVEEPSIQVGTAVLWVLGFLILLAVMVKVSKRRPARTYGPPRTAPRPVVAPPPYEPTPIPDTSARAPVPTRVGGSGFSRADDGLPVFTRERKAAGVDPAAASRLPRSTRTAAQPPHLPLPTQKPPNARPPAPAVRIIKGYNQ